jgi:pentatricopeptide repeat protein
MQNVQLYTTAITAAATLGDYERALEFVSRMTFAGVKPNIKTLTSLMGACLTGKHYGYALDVFKKINKPDGYATMLGIRAFSNLGEFDSALSMVDNNEEMTGKQIMSSYSYIISRALEQRNYEAATAAMNNLMKNNFIPSKEILRKIIESLGLNFSREKKAKMVDNRDESYKIEEMKKFKFLLYVLDTLEKRKLHASAQFYNCILFEGARLGKLYKKIASIIQKARVDTLSHNAEIGQEEGSNGLQVIHWIDLLENYSEYRDNLDQLALPLVRVRINSEKEIRQVLFAEQNVTYNPTTRGRKKRLAQQRR